jgi:hypothetical protein
MVFCDLLFLSSFLLHDCIAVLNLPADGLGKGNKLPTDVAAPGVEYRKTEREREREEPSSSSSSSSSPSL